MLKIKSTLLFALSFISVFSVSAQNLFQDYEHLFTPPQTYIVQLADTALVIDGKPSEDAWSNARWSQEFVDIEGSKKPLPAHSTRFKMLWDQEHLYILAELIEPHVWATLKNHDQIVYHDNDFEVFIDPDGDTHKYYEIELNAFNTVFDLYMPKPYRNGGSPDIKWNVKGLQSAVHIEGSINDPASIDQKWYVEMAIPFRSLDLNDKGPVPSPLSVWNLNFSRVQWDTEIKAGEYKKLMDTAKNRPRAEHNWVWSPQGVINMHFPERWGYIRFSDQKAGAEEKPFGLPASYEFKKHLFLVYYRQKEFFRTNKTYAQNTSELKIPKSLVINQSRYSLKLEASAQHFKASIQSAKGIDWHIDQDGRIYQQ